MVKRFPGIELAIIFHLAIAWAFIPASAFAEEPDQQIEDAETAKSQAPPSQKPPLKLQKIPSAQVAPPAPSEDYVDEPSGPQPRADEHPVEPKEVRQPKHDHEDVAEESAEEREEARRRLLEELKKRLAEEATRSSTQLQETGED